MKIAIIGAGGVGGYFGGQLAASGADVTFIARGDHLAAMLEHGLTVESAAHPVRVHPVNATGDAATVGPVDFVIIAVKLWSTAEALDVARRLLGPGTGVVSLQNGVDAVRVLSEGVGRAHVMGGVVQIGAVIERPGVVRHTGMLARLFFGELDGSASPRAEAFLATCLAAGIEAKLSPDIEQAIWEKFIFLAALSGTTCITRGPIGPIREDADTRALLESVMEEVAAVGRAEGVGLLPDVVERQLKFVDGLPPEMVSSMLGDLRRGSRLELPWLAGAVVRLGREHGIPTPANHAIYAALKLYEKGGRASP